MYVVGNQKIFIYHIVSFTCTDMLTVPYSKSLLFCLKHGSKNQFTGSRFLFRKTYINIENIMFIQGVFVQVVVQVV